MKELQGGPAFRAVPASGGVWFITIRALGRGGRAAIEDGFKVSALGARRVRASVFNFQVVKGAKGAGWRFLFAPVLDITKLLAFFALGLGREGVGSFHYAGTAIQMDGRKHSLDGFRLDIDNH